MAGSRKWMLYTADNTTRYAVQIDESNGEAANFDDLSLLEELALGGGTFPKLPRGASMRYANCRADDGSSRKVWLGKPTNASGIGWMNVVSILLPTFQSVASIGDAIPYLILSLAAETFRGKPNIQDTGLTDGDGT